MDANVHVDCDLSRENKYTRALSIRIPHTVLEMRPLVIKSLLLVEYKSGNN